MHLATEKKRVSRYDLTKAIDLGQLGKPPASSNVETAIVAVPDPNRALDSRADQRVLARVNRRVDILEWERSHNRISDDAYLEGRIIQALFERASLGGGGSAWNDGSRVDAEVAKELALRGRVRLAEILVDYGSFMLDTLGENDAAIVSQVLRDSRAYGDVVLPRRYAKKGTRHAAYVAQRFRDALESLAAKVAETRKSGL